MGLQRAFDVVATRDVAVLNEFETIALLSRPLKTSAGYVTVGIGDDAAVLRLHGEIACSVDSCLEGRHFDLRWLSVAQAAVRAFVAAISDLAAMAAEPLAALSAIVVPGPQDEAMLAELAEAQARISADYGCPIVGGNVTRGAQWEFTTTVIGKTKQPMLRSGARPGQELWLLGEVGAAATGLSWLTTSAGAPSSSAIDHCVRAWREPTAQTRAALELAGMATAGIDISDGLAAEAGHIATASGVSLVIEEAALRGSLSSHVVKACLQQGLDPMEQALYGGEDYALLAVCPPGSQVAAGQRIGRVELSEPARRSGSSGLFLETRQQDGSSKRTSLNVRGYDHLALR